jgi:predicted enzyme related to lactoylglutathione lyase
MTEVSAFRPGDVSYLRIPAPDPLQSGAFYSAVFGWQLRPGTTSFQDASGHVIGHFMPELPVAGEAGIIPYIYVQSIDVTLADLIASGGEIVRDPYPEGDLWVAMTRDPAGNAIGVWQHGARLQNDS